MSIQGLEALRQAPGKNLTRIRRYVLGLGTSNDAFGHGITELTFDDFQIVVRPGPNEDYLVLEPGPLDSRDLDPQYWTEVELFALRPRPAGVLRHVDIYTDGLEDVALIFEFDSGDRFSIVLCDTDVAIGSGLEHFSGDLNDVKPIWRERIA